MPDGTDTSPLGVTSLDAASLDAGLARLLRLRFDDLGPDRVVIRWTVDPDQHQPAGLVHGGVHCAVVETAASVGAALWYGDAGQVVGVSNSTDFLRAVREGELTAVAAPVQRGRTQQLWTVDITDSDGRLVATGRVRLANIPATARATGG